MQLSFGSGWSTGFKLSVKPEKRQHVIKETVFKSNLVYALSITAGLSLTRSNAQQFASSVTGFSEEQTECLKQPDMSDGYTCILAGIGFSRGSKKRNTSPPSPHLVSVSTPPEASVPDSVSS